jgi:predicted HTH transcriptional regulator
MKENSTTIINLSEITGDREFLSGNEFGRSVFQQLQQVIIPSPGRSVFGISLAGIKATDASFPRESVIALIKLLSGEAGIFLKDFTSKDLIDNWDYAAKAKNQPVIIIQDTGYQVIGPDLNEGMKELLDFVMAEKIVTTSKVAKKFDISAQNASAKLKKLHTLGLILGAKEVAETGGLEYVYKAIK